MTHDLEMNFNKIAPFGKEDTAKELQDHAAKTQDTLVDAVENAEARFAPVGSGFDGVLACQVGPFARCICSVRRSGGKEGSGCAGLDEDR